MRALPWATRVTTGYQRDSSSKRPMSSVTLAWRALYCRWKLPLLWKTTEPFSAATTGPWQAVIPYQHGTPLLRRIMRRADASSCFWWSGYLYSYRSQSGCRGPSAVVASAQQVISVHPFHP